MTEASDGDVLFNVHCRKLVADLTESLEQALDGNVANDPIGTAEWLFADLVRVLAGAGWTLEELTQEVRHQHAAAASGEGSA